MKVKNMISDRTGRAIPNQFIIDDGNGKIYFQSYNTVIALISRGRVFLDENSWDYSVTTGRYRNQFLGEKKAETERKIKDRTYGLIVLNH